MKYNYKLIRSRRKTLSVSITTDNSITVRAPYGIAESKIDAFLNGKSSWIDKKLQANAGNIAANEEITSYKSVLIGGEKFKLVIGVNTGFDGAAVRIEKLADLKKLYINEFGGQFLKRFEDISKATDLSAASVKFRSYKSRWGCCDSKGNVVFNYKILMLPSEIQNYVIVHELCHTRQMNHSQRFWKEVGKVLPGYKALKAELKSYAFITRLYP